MIPNPAECDIMRATQRRTLFIVPGGMWGIDGARACGTGPGRPMTVGFQPTNPVPDRTAAAAHRPRAHVESNVQWLFIQLESVTVITSAGARAHAELWSLWCDHLTRGHAACPAPAVRLDFVSTPCNPLKRNTKPLCMWVYDCLTLKEILGDR